QSVGSFGGADDALAGRRALVSECPDDAGPACVRTHGGRTAPCPRSARAQVARSRYRRRRFGAHRGASVRIGAHYVSLVACAFAMHTAAAQDSLRFSGPDAATSRQVSQIIESAAAAGLPASHIVAKAQFAALVRTPG